ncbi:MAG: 3'-5' exonuclease, partial [FCB group bacterium]|nr:3'-5' exonuclease [FCB group bacterium]
MIDERSILIAFDTETTGLSAADGRVVEIAALKFDIQGNILGEYSELVNPGIEIPPRAMAVHHITDEMVADMPPINEVLPRFLNFIESSETILIAQNSQFDIGFINQEALRNDARLPRNIILDQINLTRKVFPGLPTYSLENVCRRFNLVGDQTHRAMDDSILVMKLFLHCLSHIGDLSEALKIINSLYHYSFGGPIIVKTDEAIMTLINQALEKSETLEIVYLGGSMKGRPRLITPTVMYNRDGVGYL